MSEVELPTTSQSARILDVLNGIEKAETSGVIVVNPEHPELSYVLHGRTLLNHLHHRGNVEIGEVTPHGFTFPMTPYPDRDPVTLSANFRKSAISFSSTQFSGRSLFLGHIGNGKFIAPNKALGDILGLRLILCRCRKIDTHIFEPEELIRKGWCNFDDAAVDCG